MGGRRGQRLQSWALGTYKQWQERGAQVRKSARSTVIVFYKELERPAKRNGTRQAACCWPRASSVFNVVQVDGSPLPDPNVPTEDRIDPLTAVDVFAAATGAKVAIGGDQAFYDPAADTITMPDRPRFVGSNTLSPTEAWYSTLLHELAHWTGANSRLARDLSKRFGSGAYAMEELVAELGAAFLCAELGSAATPRPDHAAYLAGWLKIMKADKRAIFSAASTASRAADYLKGLSERPMMGMAA